jgi:hypothetical protein
MGTIIFKRDIITARKILKSWEFILWKTKTGLLLIYLSKHFGKLLCTLKTDDKIVISGKSDPEMLRDLLLSPLKDNVIKNMIGKNKFKKKFMTAALNNESSFCDYINSMGILIEIQE